MEIEITKLEADENKEAEPVLNLNHPKIALGMAYVPYQEWGELYDADIGFHRGTIFPALDKPFIGEGALSNE
jgi:hypothetical protein